MESTRSDVVTGCPRAGLKVLVPGYAQWSWRQRERGLVLFGSFAAALTVGGFAWGTRTGLVVLAFAFGTHVASVVDVIRQSSFPGFGRWVPWFSASAGLGLAMYVPALVLASLVAWPAYRGGSTRDAYLVDYGAYRGVAPRRGDWVWLRAQPPRRGTGIGRVVATARQEVEWAGDRLRVDGAPAGLDPRSRRGWPPSNLAFTVPEGHVLVDARPVGPTDAGPVLVPVDQVAGRAWARLYPIWKRRLLPRSV